MTSAKPGSALQQVILAQLLLVELVLFSVIGTHFFQLDNFLQIVRVSTELGLISMAMTMVIVTGGIDLSVGSMLGLCAVSFGKLWRDCHLPWPIAAMATLLLGATGGALNAGFITRLKIHPLIVTLATFALFHGIAEGMTGGADNFTHFPQNFRAIGQGHFLGLPAQLPVLFVAAVVFYLLLHRSIIGRALSVIGFSTEGALYAGIPVARRTALPYVLSGLMAALASLIYAARVGQAKADAGTGYELEAITAVVLGGTSIFGGRGTIIGTLLGLCSIEVLRNGLQMADLKPELAGIFTSALLLGATGLDHHMRRAPKVLAPLTSPGTDDEEPIMRNSQLAVLCGVILAGALIVVGGNYLLLRPVEKPRSAAAQTITVGMMPKTVGNPYFIACQKGATEAAGELGVKLLWNGPTEADPGKQNEIVENWINRKVDVIAVSCENSAGISTALREARAKGIKVITWDADSEKDARDFTVVQATAQGIGTALMDNAAKVLGGKGKFAIITASLTASNQNEWMKYIEQRRVEKYPDIQMTTVLPCDDKQPEAFAAAKTIMNSDPDVKLLLAISSAAVPGAAEAVQQSGRNDVHVVGLGLPNQNKTYVKAGITPAVILWNTMDLGYLAVYASQAAKDGSLKAGTPSFDGGRLGPIKIEGDNIMLGVPFVFTKDNIDRFDF